MKHFVSLVSVTCAIALFCLIGKSNALIPLTWIPHPTQAAILYCEATGFFCSGTPLDEERLYWNCSIRFNRLSEVGKRCSSNLSEGLTFGVVGDSLENRQNYFCDFIGSPDVLQYTDETKEEWFARVPDVDECGVVNGDDSTCKDCMGVINGRAKTDPTLGTCEKPASFYIKLDEAIEYFRTQVRIIVIITTLALVWYLIYYHLFCYFTPRRSHFNEDAQNAQSLKKSIIENNVGNAMALSRYFDVIHVQKAIALKRYFLLSQCFTGTDDQGTVPQELLDHFNRPEMQGDESEDFILKNWVRLREIGFPLPLKEKQK